MNIKRLLYILLVFTSAGMALELFLLAHFESINQAIPLISLGIFIPLILWARSRRIQFLGSIGIGIVGLVGVGFHLTSNRDFEKEMRPALSGVDLFYETLTGAMPALAPGAFVTLALIGYIITKTE